MYLLTQAPQTEMTLAKPIFKKKNQSANEVIVSIITVGMNHLELIKDYLHSLYVTCHPIVSFELIYVDNYSTDGTVKFIESNYPEVIIIENFSIKGFSANNNQGVKVSIGQYILFLNPDIILLPNAIDNLYKYHSTNPSAGIVVPKLLNLDLTHQFSARNFMRKRTLIYRFIYNATQVVCAREVRRYLLTDIDASKTQTINWAFGAAMLIKKSWFENIEGFDERYFLYVEDADICLKSWKGGRSVVYFPEAVIIHAHQQSSSKSWNKKTILHLWSIIRFFFKHKIIFKKYNFNCGEI